MVLIETNYNYIVDRIVYWVNRTIRAVDSYWAKEDEYGHINWFWPIQIDQDNLEFIREHYIANSFILQDNEGIYLPHSYFAIDKDRAELFEDTWEPVDYDNPLELQATIGIVIPLLYYELHGGIYTGIIPHICREEGFHCDNHDYEMLAEKFDLTTYSNYIVSSIKRTKILELKDIDKNSILLGFKANEDELNCSGNVFLNTNDF